MRKLVSTTITIPPELRHKLEMLAAKQTRSMSQQIVHMLTEALAKMEASENEAA